MPPAPNVVYFTCHACGMQLTVPVEIAGVSGPCPGCRVYITSPPASPAGVSSPPSAPTPAWGSPVLPSLPSLLPLAAPASAPPMASSGPGTPVSRPPEHVPVMAPRDLGTWHPRNSPPAEATPPGKPHSPSLLDQVLQRNQPPAPPAPFQETAPAPVQGLPSRPSLPPGSGYTRPTFPSSPAFRRRHASTAGEKRGAMLGALFMAALVLTGTGWFFRDQLRVAWMTHVAPRLEPDETVEAVPRSGAAPSSAARDTTPPTPSPQGDSPAPAAFDLTDSPAPAIPAVGPPVTILPAQPVSPPPPPSGLDEVPAPPKAESVPSSAPAPPAPPIVENATPETLPAVEVLKEFFAAPNWKARAATVQTSDRIQPLMEQYYQANVDEPIQVSQIQLLRHDKSPKTGGPPHCVFQVSGGGLKQPLPVMVEETPEGWKVDWLTFTEFKDELLLKFMSAYQEGPARFHVMMRRTHYFDNDVPEMDKLTCFEVQPPMPGFSGYVFARRATPLAKELDRHLGWEVTKAATTVELVWRKQDRFQWVELTALPQYNWRTPPSPPVAEAVR